MLRIHGSSPTVAARVLLAAISLLLALPVAAADEVPHAETQAGMNEAGGARLETAETQMKQAFDTLLKSAQGHAEAVARLHKAQAAWEAYRDVQLAAFWPSPDPGSYGSAHPMCVADARARLTEARAQELRAMANRVEGDVCASQWPI